VHVARQPLPDRPLAAAAGSRAPTACARDADEHRRLGSAACAARTQPARDRVARRRSDRHDALLAALAEHPDFASRQVTPFDVELREARTAQTGQ
jgi:hypothetical protein